MRRSRHSKFLVATVARDFIRAEAEGLGVTVAVTYRELLVARARLFGRPVLQRFRIRAVQSVALRHTRDVHRLVFEVGGREPTGVTVLYRSEAMPAFERLVAAFDLMSRRRRRPAMLLRRRAIARAVARAANREEGRELKPTGHARVAVSR